MKKLIYLLLCLPVLGFSQPMEWKHMNIHLNCVNFGGPNNGVAVGANSAIMYTTDGGETWIGGRSPMVGSLSSVSMADASTGWIVGVNGSGLTSTPIILKTTDGGANWTSQTSPVANLSLRSVYAVSSTVAFIACGEGGPIASTLRSTVLKTTDGGATWTDLITATPTSSPALDTSMWGISCSNTTYLASFRSIKMIDANTGYVVGGMNSTGCTQSTNMQQNRSGGKVWKTTDGGSTWMKVHMLPSNNAGFRGVDFGASGQYGFVCGNVPSVQTGVPSRSLYRTSDYGATWEFVETGVVTAMNNVRMDNENTIFLSTGAGTKGIIRSTINAQIAPVPLTNAATGLPYMGALPTFSSDTVHQTAGIITYVSSRVNKFAVGSYGLIFKGVDGTPTPTNPSGITWAIKNGGEVLNPYDGYFHDQNNGFIGSDAGRILSSTDGFTTYTTTQVPTGGPFMAGPINSVVFTDAMTGYASGSGNGVATVAVKTVDGGATWTAMPLPSGVVIQNDIHFPSPTTGYFVGNSPASAQAPVVNKLTIVGGTPSITSVSPTGLSWTGSTFTNAIFFINDLVGWVVANGGKIIKTTDGGATWAYQTLPIVPPATVPLTTNLNDVWFADLSTGFIAGNSGKMFKTTDGGATWLEQTTPHTGSAFPPGYNDLEFFDANRGFAVGGSGAWIYTENGGTTWTPVVPNLASCAWWFISKAPGAAQTDLIMGAVNLIGGQSQLNIQRSNMTRYYADADMDGYGGTTFVESFYATVPSGYSAAGGDCNDMNAAINPGATETCNSIDDDCDTVIDEGGPTWWADADADSYGDAASTINSCATSPSGYVSNDDDCNDDDAAINPAATEIADDAVDQNCDTDELCYTDADNDGYRPDATSTTVSDNLVCTDPNEAVSGDPTTDCNDTNAAINPAAAETCNSMDDDCDTMTDESGGTPSYLDGDGDTYGTPATSSTACTAPSGYVANDDDCNDANPAIKPGATETCNGIDDNCDALIDNLAVCPIPTSVTISNISSNAAQFNWLGGCTTGWQISYRPVTNPVSAFIVVNVAAPAASKIVSGLTPNTQYQYRMRSSCTGNTYSAYTAIKSFWTVTNVNTYFQDADGDTFGNPSATANGTTAPSGYVSNSNDCDDTNAAVKPGAIELCNGIDDNCDGIVDNVAACPKPVGLSTSGITSTEAMANWGSVVCATSFDVQYKKVGTSVYTTLSAGAGSVSAAMTGLLPGTNYHWRIRAKCPGNKNSAYTALLVFTTPATSAAPGATTEVTANEEVATEERGTPAFAEATVSIEQLFPNPATETIHLVLATETERSVQVLVTNAVGQVVRRQSFDLGDGASVLEISVDGLPAGAYQVSVAGTAGSRTFVKI